MTSAAGGTTQFRGWLSKFFIAEQDALTVENFWYCWQEARRHAKPEFLELERTLASRQPVSQRDSAELAARSEDEGLLRECRALLSDTKWTGSPRFHRAMETIERIDARLQSRAGETKEVT